MKVFVIFALIIISLVGTASAIAIGTSDNQDSSLQKILEDCKKTIGIAEDGYSLWNNQTHKITTGSCEIKKRTNSGISLDPMPYPILWNITSPIKQLELGLSFDEIQCNQNLVLIQKYDGTPACVTESTKTKLIERGWTSTNDNHNTDGSSNGHWKLKSEAFVAIPSHELTPIDTVNVDGRYSATAILTKPHGMSDQYPSLGYVMYVQILDPNGDTIAGSWHHGTIQTNQTISAGTYWSPKDVGKYTIEVFVWQSFTGTPHADVSRHTVKVTE